jgi:hypothetical protein
MCLGEQPLAEKRPQHSRALNQQAEGADARLRQVQECNKQAVRENCSLKNKLGQAITVLRMYHHKVRLHALCVPPCRPAPPAGAQGRCAPRCLPCNTW